MNKKSMEEFVKENGIYDEKEDSYSFDTCFEAALISYAHSHCVWQHQHQIYRLQKYPHATILLFSFSFRKCSYYKKISV